MLPGIASAQYYRVSGVVDFTYRAYETKSGDGRSSSEYWTQNYQTGLAGFVWDPRFMLFSSSIGYSIYTSDAGSDSDALNYSLSANFFPGRIISWDVYGRRLVSTVDSLDSGSTSIAGYDINTTTYGGALNLHLGSLGRNGRRYNNNRNNNNNNNNNAGNGLSLLVPDISLSHDHIESESFSESSPYHEVRDNSKAAFYVRRSTYNFVLSGAIEDYLNKVDYSSYTTKSGSLTSRIAVSKNGEFTLNGDISDRQTENMTDYNTMDKSQSYDAMLKFKEMDNFQHYYQYYYSSRETEYSVYNKHNFSGTASYKFTKEVEAHTGLSFSSFDYHSDAHDSYAEESSAVEAGSILLGATYRKQYKPDFMKAFSINTSYDFTLGFANYTDKVDDPADEGDGKSGSGPYYTNSAGLGLQSLGWSRETASFGYYYSNKRDSSPIHNNGKSQAFHFSFSSTRLPKTTVDINGQYQVVNNKSELGSLFVNGSGNEDGFAQYQRSNTYSINFNHRVSTFVAADWGASRGATMSNVYSLSTLSTSDNTSDATESMDTAEYLSATMGYPFGRNLLGRLTAREEFRTTEASEGSVTRTETRYTVLNLDYRYRAIFVNAEYRWRQDIPDDTARTTQQYFYVKLTRPF